MLGTSPLQISTSIHKHLGTGRLTPSLPTILPADPPESRGKSLFSHDPKQPSAIANRQPSPIHLQRIDEQADCGISTFPKLPHSSSCQLFCLLKQLPLPRGPPRVAFSPSRPCASPHSRAFAAMTRPPMSGLESEDLEPVAGDSGSLSFSTRTGPAAALRGRSLGPSIESASTGSSFTRIDNLHQVISRVPKCIW